MKRKYLWLLPTTLLLFPLASCSGNSSSTTGDSTPTPTTPVYLYDDYQRDGSLSLGIRSNLYSVGYESPISLFYQADEKKAYGDDASLQIYPYKGLSGTDSEKLNQAEINRTILHALMAMSYSMLKDTDLMDMETLPVLVDRYSRSFESYADVPDETIAFNSIDGTAGSFITQKEDGKDSLLFYSAGENLSESLSGIDLSTIQINAPALLSYLKETLSGNTVLETILSSVGGIVNFLMEGVDLSVDCPSQDESVITFTVNEKGKEQLMEPISDLLGSLEGFGDISSLVSKIADISFSLSLYNDDILINQIESLNASFSLQTVLGKVELYFDADLDRKATKLDPGSFQSKKEIVDGYAKINEEVKDFFDTVSAYVPFKTSLLGEEEVDPSKIDVSDAIVPTLEKAASDYFALSDDAKTLLGPVFMEVKDEEAMKELLLARHEEGVKTIKDMLSSFEKEGNVTEDNYQTLFGTVADYLNWEQGVQDKEGLKALDSLYSYLASRMDEIEDILSGKEDNALDTFIASPKEENLSPALELDNRLQDLLSLDRKYLSGERLTRFESLEEKNDSFRTTLQKAGHDYLATRLSGIDYEALSALAQEEVVQNADFFNRSLLADAEKEDIGTLVEEEGKEIRKALLENTDSKTSLTATYTSLLSRLSTLRSTEETFLGTEENYRQVLDFYDVLLEALD